MLTRPATDASRVANAARALPHNTCVHCGNALPSAATDAFCCAGCQAVHAMIADAGLLRYYDLRDATITPAAAVGGALSRRDHNWLEPLIAKLAHAQDTIELTLKLQGLRCAACVWLIQALFERQPGAHRVLVDSGLGRVSVCVDSAFPLAHFVAELEAFGYSLGEDAADAPQSDELLLRTGICLALGGNAMMFAIAIYLGLSEGPLYRVLHALNFACATLAVLIGAPVFLRSAWQALRRRILHLDLPIALGIVLSYSAALWSFASSHYGAAYYDSLSVFIALMLLGRWLKERVVVANRKQLLADDGIDKLVVRRVDGDHLQLVAAASLRAGDCLLVPPGDLIPVASVLLEGPATCSLDWINGESEPVLFAQGALVPAGAFNAEASALRVRTQTDFAASELVQLLGRRDPRALPADRRAHLFALGYVLAVLATATAAFAVWFWTTGSVARGLEVATAICVVTCPCAIGVATPLAEDFVLAGLRRAGLFVRSATFLERARAVRRIVFDKTGTLTTGRLRIENPGAFALLSERERNLLYTMAAASVHPKSTAVVRALHAIRARLVPNVEVREVAGQGIEAAAWGHRYRFGRAAFVLGDASAETDRSDLTFGNDGRALCRLRCAETLRADAAGEIAQLGREGYALWILSGDDPARVHELGRTLGIPEALALGGFTPQAKCEFIAAHDADDLLMIGDGLNDSLAIQQAFTSGTPSIDRAFLAWRSDFYFVTAGLAPIRLSLKAARRLADVIRRNQLFAVTYNLGVVSIALAGWMQPWIAAVLMPASSLVVLATTSWSLSARSALWKS